jgi:hypothetical protein
VRTPLKALRREARSRIWPERLDVDRKVRLGGVAGENPDLCVSSNELFYDMAADAAGCTDCRIVEQAYREERDRLSSLVPPSE